MSTPAASKFDELDPQVKEMLRKLEPDEVATLRYVSTIPKDEFRDIMKFIRDWRAVGKFGRWMFFAAAGTLITMAAFGDAILKMMGWIKK